MFERDLSYFLALAQTRNFTRAAEKMYVTQPAFSRRIADLEERMGCQLVLRKTRPVELTPAGEVFLKWALVLSRDIEQMESAMERARQGVTGQLRIGYNGSNHLHYLNAGLRALEAYAPQIECVVKRGEPPRLEQYLKDGRVDGIFTSLPHASHLNWVDYIPVEHCGITALFSSRNPLAHRQGVHMAEIADKPYVNYDRDMSPYAYDFVLAAFAASNASPNVTVCVQDVEEIAVMVAADRGFALMSDTAAHSFCASRPDQLAALPLLDYRSGFDLVFAWHKDRVDQNLLCFRNALSAPSSETAL